MPNYLMRCLSYKVFFFCLVLMVTHLTPYPQDNHNPGTKKLYLAKRSFIEREKDYLRNKPLSDDLRWFIKRLKRKTPIYFLSGFKNKRQDETSDRDMFVVHNGNIEPLENMREVTAIPENNPSGLGNFTVIPLVIPITVKTFSNVTYCHETESEEPLLPIESFRHFGRDEDKEKTAKTEEKNEEKETKTQPTIFIKAVSLTINTENGVSTNTSTTTTSSTTEENVVDSAVSTMKSDGLRFLDKVLNDVQELISYEKEGKAAGNNEGAMCTVIGDWDSKACGMQLQITPARDPYNSPSVQVVEQDPMADEGFLRYGKWNITSNMPFNHSSLLVLTAVSEKTVATFLGDCRICQGAETINGNWMLMRRSSNCKDRQESHSFFSDVMRRNNVRRLQKAHLDELSTRDLTSTTQI